jgi:group I intron endonuclease
MHYIIYKTTNLLDGKYYVGCHQTQNLNDDYLGSGKHLKRAIKKYGLTNFKFEILHEVTSKEEMFELERNIVNKSLVNDPFSYNLKIGGSGGNPGIVGAFTGKKHTEETKEKQRLASLNQQTSDETRKKLSDNNWSKKDPESHREHMRKIARMPRSAKHNRKVAEANLGKILVNNMHFSKRIYKSELSYYESIGWKKGGMPRKRILSP